MLININRRQEQYLEIDIEAAIDFKLVSEVVTQTDN